MIFHRSIAITDLLGSQDSNMSRTPSPFDYGCRSNSSPIPFSEPPNYSNYTGHIAPHATFVSVQRTPCLLQLQQVKSVHRKARLQDRESANGAKKNAKWSDDQTLVLVEGWSRGPGKRQECRGLEQDCCSCKQGRH